MASLILHVDDDPHLPDGVVAVLEADGYEWVRSSDPEQVMRLVEDEDPALVVIEIDLPHCDGLDLLNGIVSARGGQVPVLVLTRVPRDSGMHGEAIALGVTEFLSKPVLRAQLLSAIRELARPVPAKAPAEPAAKAPAAPASSGPDLSGEIADAPVPELVARMHRRAAAGVLKLHHAGAVVGIQFRNGTPICVGSNRRDAAASGVEAEALLFETFAWADGTWEFFDNRRLPADSSLELSGDPGEWLMRGVLQAVSGERARERLSKRATLYVSVSEDWQGGVAGVEPTPKQAAILAELSGQELLGDLLASMEFEERMLYGLWVAGALDLHAVPTLDLSDLEDEPPAREPERPASPSARPPRATPAARPRAAASRAAPVPASGSREEISQALRELAQQVMAGDDFEALDVAVDAGEERLREAYQRQLDAIPRQALDGHDLELRARAERIRDRIESAYAHLKDPESRRAYALLRKEERTDQQAERDAERALEGERWFRKGRGHLDQRRYPEAVEAFGMASHLDAKEGEYLAYLGYALFVSKPGDKVVQREAMEHVANGIKRSPNREMSYVFLGRILRARGEDEAAAKVFRRALRIKPDNHPALQEIRLLEMRKRKGKGILSRLMGS